MPTYDIPPLILRKVLFGNPDKALPTLSPDGTKLAYIAPVDGVMNLWVAPAHNIVAARPVTDDAKRGIREYYWAYTDHHILYLQDNDGDENYHVHAVDTISGESKALTPIESVRAQSPWPWVVPIVSAKAVDEIIVGLNDRDPKLHDLYRINIHTGERRLVEQNNHGFVFYVTDDYFDAKVAVRLRNDGGNDTFRKTDQGDWEPFMEVAADDLYGTIPRGFDKTRANLHLTDCRGRDTAVIATINLDTGTETVIADSPLADLSDTMVHPRDKNIQAAAFTYARKEWQILDDSIAADLEYLRTVNRGDIEVVSRTLDDNHWIVSYLTDNGPERYYRYDREQGDAEFLFTNQQGLEELSLASMHPIVIKSRDMLDLVCYYTLPIDSARDRDDRPDSPIPMVLLVHGGPWARDSWGYRAWDQWLANRGYAVLSVNFRGSTGFGKAFLNAGNLEWGRKMQDDLLDSVQWAIDEGIADPKRIAIFGASYGGYAALAGLTFTPGVFACGIDLVGISNLVTLADSFAEMFTPLINLFPARMGDHRTEEGRAFLAERSPLNYVDQIDRPLLIYQGANDARVMKTETDKIVDLMRVRKVPVTYLVYPDEGHAAPARSENNLSLWAVTEAFLAQHLGGRVEPIGEDFKGSSITITVGAEHISGIGDAVIRA